MRVTLSAATLAAAFLSTTSAIAQLSAPDQPNAFSQNSRESADADETDVTPGLQQDVRAKPGTPDAPKPRGDAAVRPDTVSAGPERVADIKTGCTVVAPPTLQADEVSWSGPCTAGLADGAGTMSLSTQGRFLESFAGTFDKGELRDGHVVIKWADGSHYEGNAVGAAMQGSGALTTAAGDKFEGLWKAGKLDGRGTAVWANGDRYSGDWLDGKAEGQGVQDWADGRQYNGQWHNDLPNGHGIIRRKDGNRFEGEFLDGQPSSLVQLAVAANTAIATPAVTVTPPVAKPSVTPDAPKTTVAVNNTISPPTVQHTAISGVAGKKLVAVDGSSLTLTTIEDGLAREIVAPNGNVKKNTFSFLGDRVGAVSEGDDTDNVTGVFRLTDKGIITNYSDGRSEQLYPNAAGGVSMTLSAPTGQTFCMAWYPEGHHFSVEERKAALAAYANKLGLDDARGPPAKKSKVVARPACTPLAEAATLPAEPASIIHQPVALPDAKPVPQPVPREANARPLRHRGAAAPKVVTASFAPSTDPLQMHEVEVRPSIVHVIDADTPSNASIASNGPSNAPGASASHCLSVESDGQHWGFRNHCGYDVQFAYCLMNARDPLAACDKGGVMGSVAPNGSSALVLDRSLTEKDADHDFRWVACTGGAGEVVVHLDQADPPSGRCVRRSAS